MDWLFQQKYSRVLQHPAGMLCICEFEFEREARITERENNYIHLNLLPISLLRFYT